MFLNRSRSSSKAFVAQLVLLMLSCSVLLFDLFFFARVKCTIVFLAKSAFRYYESIRKTLVKQRVKSKQPWQSEIYKRFFLHTIL